jgi:mannose-6-phosphate isomerase-like protein (cupin superfamily)
MTDEEIVGFRRQLEELYPGSHVKVADDNKEMVAEKSGEFAVAVIEKSQAHFHLKTQETYRVLHGTLYLACGGSGHVLHEGESMTIQPGQVHFARGAGSPAIIEVFCKPAWSSSDHFIL